MTFTTKPGLTRAVILPSVIFCACIFISVFNGFTHINAKLSMAILGDLLLTAPLAYYLAIRKTTVSKITVLRVFIGGVLLSGVLVSKNDSALVTIIKTWISPIVEIALIGLIVSKFYSANKSLKKSNGEKTDFLVHCRAILTSAFGSKKVANVLASEAAVFYYAFSKKDPSIDDRSRFTCYKDNGSVLILSTFLVLFIIEAIGMHFLFVLWNRTIAWVIMAGSCYTCLQLLAHIKALKARPVIIRHDHLLLRGGLMGGDALVLLDDIEKTEMTNKIPAGHDVVKIALIKGLENHNIAIYLASPAVVTKAFGIKKTAKVILANIDNPKAFIGALESKKNMPIRDKSNC